MCFDLCDPTLPISPVPFTHNLCVSQIKRDLTGMVLVQDAEYREYSLPNNLAALVPQIMNVSTGRLKLLKMPIPSTSHDELVKVS